MRRWVALVLAFVASQAFAQAYPSKPINFIVPFAPGGPADGLSRNMAAALSKNLKQPLVVENVGGAGGTIGTLRVARAAPDGYTIMYHNLGMVLAPALVAKLEYDPVTDFDYLGVVTVSYTTLIARADLPVKGFADFVAYLKSQGDKVMFANAGLGGISHLCGLLLANTVQSKFTMVPYKGNGPATNDLVGGRVDLMCDAAATAAPQIRAGKVRAIGTAGLVRNRELPEVPTLDEQGLKGFVLENWNAIYAPRGLQRPVFQRLVAAVQASMRDADFVSYLDKAGYTAVAPEATTPEALAQRVRTEIPRWSRLLREAGIKPQ